MSDSGLISTVGKIYGILKTAERYLSIYFSINPFCFTPTALTVYQLTFIAVGVSKQIQLAEKLSSTGLKVTAEWAQAEAIKNTLKTFSITTAFALSAQSINNAVTALFNGLQSATMVIWDTIMC